MVWFFLLEIHNHSDSRTKLNMSFSASNYDCYQGTVETYYQIGFVR